MLMQSSIITNFNEKDDLVNSILQNFDEAQKTEFNFLSKICAEHKSSGQDYEKMCL